jgi:hypothetical protein
VEKMSDAELAEAAEKSALIVRHFPAQKERVIRVLRGKSSESEATESTTRPPSERRTSASRRIPAPTMPSSRQI